MLAQRLRRWPSIEPPLRQRIVLAVFVVHPYVNTLLGNVREALDIVNDVDQFLGQCIT